VTRGHSLQYPGGHAPRDRPNLGDTTAELYNSGLCHSLNTLGTLNADRAYLKVRKMFGDADFSLMVTSSSIKQCSGDLATFFVFQSHFLARHRLTERKAIYSAVANVPRHLARNIMLITPPTLS
jgi:hypothetical protein